ncbi:amidohydrolase [Streptomyces sp. NPDC007325]|uniref:amidohydrolase n=1 Tax=Streptomyces sp. NPDC007325 TaxID=3154588 RepID=UPI0033D9D48E
MIRSSGDVAEATRDVTAGVDGEGLTDFYRDLHRHPELSMAENRTAALLAGRLRAAGLEVTEGVGRTGVVGVLRNGDGPVVWLRGDTDALPVREETGLPYASGRAGVMHACGHDMHVTWLVGAAEALAAARDAWAGTLVVIGQPAEEGGTGESGAAAMAADGLHDRFPRPDALFGQHVAPGPLGLVLHTPGLTMAAMDDIDIRIHGRGGHGSRPEATVDPVLAAAHVVTRLQSGVSRELAATDVAVLTVGRFHAGAKHNIIPSEAELALNLRTRVPEVRERALAAIRRIVEGECAAAGCPRPPEIDIAYSLPATVDDAALDGRVAAVHRAVFGDGAVVDLGPVTGSEDVSLLAPADTPYDYWYVTSTPQDVWEEAEGESPAEKFARVPSNHSGLFAPDLSVVPVGVRTLVSAALSVFSF